MRRPFFLIWQIVTFDLHKIIETAMKGKYVVLGATGSIGYAFTEVLLSKGIRTDILVRDKKRAEDLFDKNPLLNIHVGDISRGPGLNRICEDAGFIFHGINYPYHRWDPAMRDATRQVISAASPGRATILFPGNIYSFGNTHVPIKEGIRPQPVTRKGKLRLEIEDMLENATVLGGCKVINLRLPDFWGPNVTNGLIRPLLGNAARGKPMQWMIRTDIPHQFAYTPDAAALFFRLSTEPGLPAYAEYNYGGTTVSSVRDFAHHISRVAGSPYKLRTLSKNTLNLIGLLVPEVKEIRELYYQFENSILLDDAKLRSLFPGWKETGPEEAISETIRWFRQHKPG